MSHLLPHLLTLLSIIPFLLLPHHITPQIQNPNSICFYGWGQNNQGQLDPSLKPSHIPLASPFGYDPLYGINVSFISAGARHSVVLDSQGHAYCFGSNTKGECAQGITGGQFSHGRKIVYSPSFDEKEIIFAATGESRTYLLDREGRVYYAGINDAVEIRPPSFNSPIGLLFSEPVESVSLGHSHILLLTKNGQVYGYGSNAYGQLSKSALPDEPLPTLFNTSALGGGSTKITQIATGDAHSLLLDSDGNVWGLGRNAAGELGTGFISTEKTFIPTPLNTSAMGSSSTKITQISAGSSHSLVLSSEGRVYSFGSNDEGQLGRRGESAHATNKEPLPGAVNTTGVLHDKVITQISAGRGMFSLLLSSEGEVFSFGWNRDGQLGIGKLSFMEPFPVKLNMSAFPPGVTITQISAGIQHSLFLSSEARVYACGLNSFGQLGRGGITSQKITLPIPINTMGTFFNRSITQISATSHILSRDAFGRIFACGENSEGQTGDGTALSHYATHRIDFNDKVYQVSAGSKHSLLLTSSGEAYAWGSNDDGRLGIASFVEMEPLPVAISMRGLLRGKSIIQIAAGEHHSLVLSSDSRVFAFGSDYYGQCGNGFLEDDPQEYAPIPIDTRGALSNKNITQIAAGSVHSLVLSSEGNVYGFGDNSYGQCGSLQQTLVRGRYQKKLYSPVAVNTTGVLHGKTITQICAGDLHSLILSSEGKVYGFGANHFNQLGIGGASTYEMLPVAVALQEESPPIIQIAAGSDHGLILNSEGQLFAFGRNSEKQLGVDSPLASVASPMPVILTHISTMENVTTNSSLKIFAQGHQSFISFCYVRTCFGKEHLHPKVCSGRGGCVRDNVCLCDAGYAGRTCEYSMCYGLVEDDPLVCSAQGNCTSPDHCTCEENYQGEACADFQCSGVVNTDPNVCKGNGQCIAPNLCLCRENFQGTNCDVQVKCFGRAVQDRSVCSAHGECVGINVCKCSLMWAGSECEQPSSALLSIIIGSALGAVLVICLFGGAATAIVVGAVRMLKTVKRVKEEKRITEHLLEGFVRDMEMDEMDADSQRAKLIVQKSMLEIDFSELSELKKIGSGGSGAILFRALWNGTIVAVKVFKSGLMSGERFFDEFEHEVSLMSTLRHRNVINFYGCSLAYPRIAIVMELCEAGSVENLIENGTLAKKSSHELLRMLLDVAEGMNYLHAREVIHRDLKCANVLVDEHGVCKLTDFGLSKYTKDQVEKAHTVGIGTSYYAAPEVAQGSGSYGPSVDVYAFGIMAMEMLLCRMCPFPASGGDQPANVLTVQQRAIQDASYRPVVEELDEKYSFLRWVLKQCWHEDPGMRPPFRDIVKILKSSLFDANQ